MRKIITAGLAALTLAGGLGAASANAEEWRGGNRHHDGSGAAVAAGIAGLAIGAALASDHDRYDGRGYDRGYGDYRSGYYYRTPARAYGDYDRRGYYDHRRCVTRTVWDPYWGEYTQRTRCWR